MSLIGRCLEMLPPVQTVYVDLSGFGWAMSARAHDSLVLECWKFGGMQRDPHLIQGRKLPLKEIITFCDFPVKIDEECPSDEIRFEKDGAIVARLVGLNA